MRCLLVLAMLSFSTAIAVLSIEEKTMEDKEMIPEKELTWKKGVKEELTWKKGLKKMGERRSEPPSYMFHMLEQFSKEGRRGFARSILPMKGGGIFPAQFNVIKNMKKYTVVFTLRNVTFIVSELSTGKEKFIVTSLLIYKSATILKLSCVV